MEWYRKSDAKSNLTGASYYIGLFYEIGRAVKQDIVEAIKWYQKSGVKKVAIAGLVRMGIIYENGKGNIKTDTLQALNYYENAAKDGNPFGMLFLGRHYQFLNKNEMADSLYARAFTSLKKEITRSLDDTEAMIGLSMMYENGHATEKKLQTAIEWYTRAAELGDIDAKAKLATFNTK